MYVHTTWCTSQMFLCCCLHGLEYSNLVVCMCVCVCVHCMHYHSKSNSVVFVRALVSSWTAILCLSLNTHQGTKGHKRSVQSPFIFIQDAESCFRQFTQGQAKWDTHSNRLYVLLQELRKHFKQQSTLHMCTVQRNLYSIYTYMYKTCTILVTLYLFF